MDSHQIGVIDSWRSFFWRSVINVVLPQVATLAEFGGVFCFAQVEAAIACFNDYSRGSLDGLPGQEWMRKLPIE